MPEGRMDGDASFGHWLRLRRKALRLSCAELARRVSCATITLRKIEADERRPSQPLAAKLAEQLGLAPHERPIFIKVARGELGVDRLALPEQIVDRPALAAGISLRTKLPAQPTELIGRAYEVAQLCRLVRTPSTRLVTLTGSGGVGKTRLALQVAAELLDEFADGIFFVNLAPIADGNLLASAIAQTLGLREAAGRPLLDQLKDQLQRKHLLLLLDNFEQIVVAATTVADLLATCPHLTVLVTSREILHLRGEKEFAVPPLTLPDIRHLPPPAALAQYAAVELFVARARDVQHDFVLSDERGLAVAEICTRLDGLPLAIELAAARMKVLTPQALLGQLGDRLKLLTGGARDLPTRQQKLRNTIDWSYALLDAPEQRLFRWLGVFVGGCSLEAIEAVCSATLCAPDALPIDMLDRLTALVDKSLLKREEGADGRSRFIMLETIREYALEQLVSSGEADAVRQQHATFYRTLVEAAESKLRGPLQKVWLDQLEEEHDNVRVALAWSQTTAAGIELGLALASALWWFWEVRGYLSEGRAWLEQVLSRSIPSALLALRTKALNAAGNLSHLQGDHGAAQAHFTESLPLAEAIGDKANIGYALDGLGSVAHFQGDYERAAVLYRQSLALLREAADTWGVAWSLGSQALGAEAKGEYRAAAALYTESFTCWRELGNKAGMAFALNGLGKMADCQGDSAQAAIFLEQSLALFRELGNKRSIAWAIDHLGDLARRQGDDVRAAILLEESLMIFRQLGM